MLNENNAPSAQPGNGANDPAALAGQSGNGQGVPDYEKAYRELEAKMGQMGNELGEYRNFFQNINPLLEKLDQNPVLVQAIAEGKIDQTLAQAIAEGKITIPEAAVVSQASQEVLDATGKKAIEAMTPENVTALVEQKAQEIRKSLEEDADIKSFEDKTQKFIETTSDFGEYSDEISAWLDSHDVTDIEVAYWAVKGQMSEAAAKKAADEAAAERGKDFAANASGGGVYATNAPDGTPMIDKLVGGPANPIF